MSVQPLHSDEIRIRLQTVRQLLDRDAPDLSGFELRPARATGSSNLLFRLGPEHLVRLPRQPGDTSIVKEARWLPALEGHLPVAVPAFVVVGEPGFGYPNHWAVTSWLEGVPAGGPVPPGPLAAELAAAMLALHAAPVPAGAVTDPTLRWYRGGDLRAIDAEVRRYLLECRAIPGLDLDLDGCLSVWEDAMTLPPPSGPDRWLHGDLLAENLLLDTEGRLSAVLDFGGLSLGCPDADLMVAWEVLDAPAREVFRAAIGADDVVWRRGRAWALAVAVMTFPYFWATLPARCTDRLRMARSVLEDWAR